MTDLKSTLFALIKMQRAKMPPAQRRRKSGNPRGIAWIYPHALERQYYQSIKKIMQKFTEEVNFTLKNSLDRWIKEFNPGMNTDSRQDAYPDDLVVMVSQLKGTLEEVFKTKAPETRVMITNIGFDVNYQNKAQLNKFVNKMVGIEFFTDEPWEGEVIDAWGNTNFELIQGLSSEYIKGINTIVSEGVQSGQSSKYIFDKILALDKTMTEARAKLIAVDQVGKLNGQMTKRRQEEAGIETYLWSTVGDQRVRGNPSGHFPGAVPSHWIMEHPRKLYRWDNPGLYSDDNGKTWKQKTGAMEFLIPGWAIRCRCTALPNFEDIVSQVDKMLEEEEKVA